MDHSAGYASPFDRFRDVYARAVAASPTDANAVTLATVDAHGRPSARIVLLKQFDDRGFVLFTNRRSRKGTHMALNRLAALCAYWSAIGEQVKIEGAVEQVSDAESDEYFASRPRESQIGAWASEQSEVLASRDHLLNRYREFDKKFAGRDVPRPAHWGGYRIVPDRIEFWTSSEFRLHHRVVYTRLANAKTPWKIELLNP